MEKMHPTVGDRDQFKGSGRETALVHAPIVSVNPVSSDSKQGIRAHKLSKNDSFKILVLILNYLTVELKKQKMGFIRFHL